MKNTRVKKCGAATLALALALVGPMAARVTVAQALEGDGVIVLDGQGPAQDDEAPLEVLANEGASSDITVQDDEAYNVANAEVELYNPVLYGDEYWPAFGVMLNGSSLSEDDYSIEYDDSATPGTHTATLRGEGDYWGEKTFTYRLGYSMQDVQVTTAISPRYAYTGKARKPKPTFTHMGKTLVEGVDYKIRYDNNVSIGTAHLYAEGIGDYLDTYEAAFTIAGLKVNGVDYGKKASGSGTNGGTWSWDGGSNLTLKNYDGNAIVYGGDALNVKLVGKNTVKATRADGMLYYTPVSGYTTGVFSTGNLKIYGTGSLGVKTNTLKKGQCEAIRGEKTYIQGASVSIDLSKVSGVFNTYAICGMEGLSITKGSFVTASSGVRAGGSSGSGTLMGGSVTIADSTVVINMNKNAETASINCFNGGKISNSVVRTSADGTIFSPDGPMSISNSDVITGRVSALQTITLKKVKGVTVTGDIRKTLAGSTEGKIAATHTGSASTYAHGVQDPLSKATVKFAKSSYAYTGKALSPKPTVVLGGKTLVKGTDYTVTYKANTNVGTATVTITGAGTYVGTKKATFKVVPAATKMTSVTAKAAAFAVTWNKQATQTTGYQIQYALKKDFGGAKTVTVSKATTTSKTISKLQSKKAYYVRVRTYKKVGTKTYASSWSAAKSVTTK
jgi:hypothetical protein